MTFCKTILVVIGMLGCTAADITMNFDVSAGDNVPALSVSGIAIGKSGSVFPVTVIGNNFGTVVVLASVGKKMLQNVTGFYLCENRNNAATGIKMTFLPLSKSKNVNGMKVLYSRVGEDAEFGKADFVYAHLTLSEIVAELNKADSGITVVEFIEYKDNVATTFHRVIEGIEVRGDKLITTTSLEDIRNGSAVIRLRNVRHSLTILGVLGFTSAGNKITVFDKIFSDNYSAQEK